MPKNFYITTPIYYVNDSPHIGHAYTSLAVDVMARYKRLRNYNVLFLTGTDEHGQKVEKSAKEKAMDPQEFTDMVQKRFRDLADRMEFSYDDFIRTTEDRHKTSAIALWNKLMENGSIYLDLYKGWYSVRDEAFYQEEELIDGKFAPTGAPVEWVEEESYFFNLSKWQDKLLDHYNNNPDFIFPNSRKNEVINFVKSGLKDLSISRTSFSWGIRIPQNNKHVMYVWLDALTNYISALEYPNQDSEKFKNFWPADMHFVGKDILKFHAIFWPAFLMAAGLELPKKIVAHGWWTNEGQKISKSIGNVIDPLILIDEFGLDQVRYFLMKEISFGSDGNYSRTSMISRINSDLANNIGNLAQRTLSFLQKNCEGKIPAPIKELINNDPLLITAGKSIENYKKQLDEINYNNSLEQIIKLATEANIYIDEHAPWNLKKTDLLKMNHVIYILIEAIRVIGLMMLSFMPSSANKLLDMLKIDEIDRNLNDDIINKRIEPGAKLPEPKALFDRFLN